MRSFILEFVFWLLGNYCSRMLTKTIGRCSDFTEVGSSILSENCCFVVDLLTTDRPSKFFNF